jgi:hypothetical protein
VSDVNGLLLAFRWLHTVVLILICDEVVLLVTCIKMTALQDMVVLILAIGLVAHGCFNPNLRRCPVVGVRDEIVVRATMAKRSAYRCSS